MLIYILFIIIYYYFYSFLSSSSNKTEQSVQHCQFYVHMCDMLTDNSFRGKSNGIGSLSRKKRIGQH